MLVKHEPPQYPLYCHSCGNEITKPTGSGAGYGQDDQGRYFCYPCCAVQDAEYMAQHGRITLYLDQENKRLTNWPGSLVVPYYHERKTESTRYSRLYGGRVYVTYTTVYFMFNDARWIGRHYGDDSDLIHCKRLKTAR